MFAIGHFALGYLFGKGTAKLAHVKINLPLILAASVLPDVDLLLRFLMHRGPTHSFLTITVLMIPFFVVYRKQALPYYAALLTHILIGDFVTGGVELFWPLSHNMYGVLNYAVTSLPIAITELVLFLVAVPLMYKSGDLQSLFKSNSRNWALIIPLGATLGPLLALGRGTEAAIPTLLIVPSLFYVGVFSYSLAIWLKGGNKPPDQKSESLPPRGIRLRPLSNWHRARWIPVCCAGKISQLQNQACGQHEKENKSNNIIEIKAK